MSMSSEPPLVAELGASRLAACLEALLDLGLSAGTVLDPEEYARGALERMVRLMAAERGIIFQVSPLGQLKFMTAQGVPPEEYAFSTTIVQQVVDTQQPVLSVDAPSDPRLQSLRSVTSTAVRSILAAPLLARNRLVGVLYLDNRVRAGLFKDQDVAVACAIGNHVAHALETARAARLEARLRVERRQRELADTLRQMTVSFNATLQHDEVVARLLEALQTLVPHDTWESSPQPGDARAQVLQTGEPLAGEDPIRLSIPLFVGSKPTEVLTLFRTDEPFGEHEVQMAMAVASHAGIALENARLFSRVEEMASVDQLTGVWNRRHWMSLAEHAIRHSQRTAEPLSALVLDVDHFKKFNDTHGHLVGDIVLREVAQRCKLTLRDSDLFGRFGGEEFVAILPDTPREGACQTAERLGAAIRGALFETPARLLDVRVSIGVAVWGPGEELAGLLNRADAALYQAKHEGRDCYRVAP
jgi:eukaryotic-like serine/threonine-protein kinase